MPMHYSAARYEHSLRTKHIVRLAMEKLLAYESWETIPEETYTEALEYARQNVDKVLKQESRVIWAAPLTKAELQARFQLSEALKLKAAAKREEAQAKGGLSEMPASLNGKVLSAFMKNGEPICGAFQTRTCPLEKESCPGRHACAVMRKAGRVCGGGHPACECHDKKFIKVEEMPGEGTGSGSAKAKPTSKSKEERPPEPAVPPRASVRRPRSPHKDHRPRPRQRRRRKQPQLNHRLHCQPWYPVRKKRRLKLKRRTFRFQRHWTLGGPTRSSTGWRPSTASRQRALA